MEKPPTFLRHGKAVSAEEWIKGLKGIIEGQCETIRLLAELAVEQTERVAELETERETTRSIFRQMMLVDNSDLSMAGRHSVVMEMIRLSLEDMAQEPQP